MFPSTRALWRARPRKASSLGLKLTSRDLFSEFLGTAFVIIFLSRSLGHVPLEQGLLFDVETTRQGVRTFGATPKVQPGRGSTDARQMLVRGLSCKQHGFLMSPSRTPYRVKEALAGDPQPCGWDCLRFT